MVALAPCTQGWGPPPCSPTTDLDLPISIRMYNTIPWIPCIPKDFLAALRTSRTSRSMLFWTNSLFSWPRQESLARDFARNRMSCSPYKSSRSPAMVLTTTSKARSHIW